MRPKRTSRSRMSVVPIGIPVALLAFPEMDESTPFFVPGSSLGANVCACADVVARRANAPAIDSSLCLIIVLLSLDFFLGYLSVDRGPDNGPDRVTIHDTKVV